LSYAQDKQTDANMLSTLTDRVGKGSKFNIDADHVVHHSDSTNCAYYTGDTHRNAQTEENL